MTLNNIMPAMVYEDYVASGIVDDFEFRGGFHVVKDITTRIGHGCMFSSRGPVIDANNPNHCELVFGTSMNSDGRNIDLRILLENDYPDYNFRGRAKFKLGYIEGTYDMDLNIIRNAVIGAGFERKE